VRLLIDIAKTKGWRELFVGLSINYIKVAPAMGISFVTYEFLKENVFHIK
jgi:solute carrier family 25 protein 16